MKININKTELKYLGLGAMIIIGWFLFAKPLLAPFLQGIPVFISMMVYQVMLYIGLLIVAVALLDNTSARIRASLLVFLVALSWNIISAPYTVNANGTITTTVDYWYVSADAGFGSLYQLFLPAWSVWFMVYIVTPIILGFAIPILLWNPKQIKKALK